MAIEELNHGLLLQLVACAVLCSLQSTIIVQMSWLSLCHAKISAIAETNSGSSELRLIVPELALKVHALIVGWTLHLLDGTEATIRAVSALPCHDEMISSSITVNMGCMDKDSCPSLFVKDVIDWNISDPKNQNIEQVREIRDQIKNEILNLIKKLETT